MPTWDSDQYLTFEQERTRPAAELAARIDVAAPRCVVDLGCGPGNSTAVLWRRWPSAHVIGVDSSPEMLEAARRAHPEGTWRSGDIRTWAPADTEPADVLFANASLQWVPDHGETCRRLLAVTANGGAFACQVPANWDAAPHRLMREIAASSGWQRRFRRVPREWHVHPPEFYYDTLAPVARRVDIWLTEYFHVLNAVGDIVEWYRGTGLRPWLDALPDAEREGFVAEYRARLEGEFVARADGRMLFPFRRLFVIAYR